MRFNKKFFYWSPHLADIATSKAVINSAYSFKKFGKKIDCSIINFFGEFNKHQEEIAKKQINMINFFKKNLINFMPSKGKLGSRLSFLFIFLLGFFPLKKLIQEKKPDYLIIHLITSLPLILLIFFKFETKFILRISGLPKMNFLRKFLWKIALKKIYKITCPTKATKDYLISLNILDESKIFTLYDPVIEIKKILDLKKKENEFSDKKYFLGVGRLTTQKNFSLMIKGFEKIKDEIPDLYLIISGRGEKENYLKELVESLNLSTKVIFLGYSENIFNYMKGSICFLSTSLWEDPGFVLVEAAACKVPIISSDCKNGPQEILCNGDGGYLFKSNDVDSLTHSLKNFIHDFKNNNTVIDKKKINSFKNIKQFTLFSHYNNFMEILEIN